MDFLLSKLATQLVYPLTITLLLGSVGLILLLLRRRVQAGLAFGGSLLLLWSASTETVALSLLRSLEQDYPPVPAEEAPLADAIVVLGGVLRTPENSERWSDLGSAADRLVHAVRLYRAGRAPLVVVSGGPMPWARSSVRPAVAMAELLHEWGVPREVLLLEDGSRNTYENAIETRSLLARRGIDEILLVTSALHMPRALAVFRTAGFRAQPAATDHQSLRGPSNSPFRGFPDVRNLMLVQIALKEHLGLWVYRQRGWVVDGVDESRSDVRAEAAANFGSYARSFHSQSCSTSC